MRAIVFANFVLKLTAAAFLLVLLYIFYRHRSSLGEIPTFFYAIPAVGVLLSLGSLKLPPVLRINVAVTLLSIGFALYAFELFQALRFSTDPVERAARRNGNSYDGRSKREVLRDLRQDGFVAYPASIPNLFISSNSFESDLIPLGGIANRTTVLCNESGQYSVYESDEHGFHNPKGLWNADSLEIAVVGDSFVHGSCVPTGRDMVSWIRQRRPRTLNLGMSGNGPLLMLATIREYLPALKPDVVLWVYYEGNDLIELEKEKSSPALLNYLNDNFSQGLRHRQAKIDSVLVSRADSEIKTLDEKTTTTDRIQDLLELQGLRNLLGAYTHLTPRRVHCDLPLLERILKEAKATVTSWGGTLYFIYLPSWARYYSRKNDCEELRDQVLALVRNSSIPVVDMHPIFQARRNRAELFAQHEFSFAHYGVEGYRLVAQTVLDSISAWERKVLREGTTTASHRGK